MWSRRVTYISVSVTDIRESFTSSLAQFLCDISNSCSHSSATPLRSVETLHWSLNVLSLFSTFIKSLYHIKYFHSQSYSHQFHQSSKSKVFQRIRPGHILLSSNQLLHFVQCFHLFSDSLQYKQSPSGELFRLFIHICVSYFSAYLNALQKTRTKMNSELTSPSVNYSGCS